MRQRLVVALPDNWMAVGNDNPEGVATCSRDGDDTAGALQFSLQAEHADGPPPRPSERDLIEFAEQLLRQQPEASVRERHSGPCALGMFGTAVGSFADCARVQVWVLSNSRDLVLATHTCTAEPSEAEQGEAQAIVEGLTLEERKASSGL